jgi:alpha-L-rhamnosidase
MRDNESISL